MRCASCGTRNRLSARFCDQCGLALPQVAEPVRKVVSVVFGDLVGSTALQEQLDPESAERMMSRFYEVMSELARRHGGDVEKLVGDGIVVVFGAARSEEDDALRATRCAAAMVQGLDELGEELNRGWGVRPRMRAGVCTGELVVRPGAELVGDTMNTSARLEQSAGAGEVLLGERTWRLVRHRVRLEPVPALTVRGKSGPLRAWRLLSLASPPEVTVVDAPLIGRAEPLARLRAALDEVVRTGRPRLVTVIGAPGVGKTRLLREFRADVSSRITCVELRCEPPGAGSDCAALLEQLSGVVGTGPTGGDPAAPRPGPADSDAAALAAALARGRSGILLLDDVHWADPRTLRAIVDLTDPAVRGSLLVVAAARPRLRDLTAALQRRADGYDAIDLGPLDDDQAAMLVRDLLQGGQVPARLLDRMIATAEGNPLYLTELVRLLVEEDMLVREADRWRCPQGTKHLPVPPGMHQLVAARLERLDPPERVVLERAAVIGRVFELSGLEVLLDREYVDALPSHLERLRRRELVEPDDGSARTYRFTSDIIRDGAYGLLLKQTRAELHERYARWLGEGSGCAARARTELVATHRRRAEEYRRQVGLVGLGTDVVESKDVRPLPAAPGVIRLDGTTAEGGVMSFTPATAAQPPGPPGPGQAGSNGPISEPAEDDRREPLDDETMRRLLHDLDVANDWHPED